MDETSIDYRSLYGRRRVLPSNVCLHGCRRDIDRRHIAAQRSPPGVVSVELRSSTQHSDFTGNTHLVVSYTLAG